MTDFLSFDAALPAWLIIAVATVIGITLLFIEYRNSYKFKWVRLLALTLAIICCLAILLKPAYRSSKYQEPLLVLTENYAEETVDSIARSRNVEVVTTIAKEKKRSNVPYISTNDLIASKDRIAFVLGDGLPASLLRTNPDISFSHTASSPPAGITQLNVPIITLGSPCLIEGAVYPPDSVNAITLAGPGGLEDSVTVNPKTGEFRLSINPKQAGLFVYQLRAGSIQERVPVEVIAPRRLNILFLQKFPTFETRQLKDFLGKQGHSVTLRNQVSKNTFRFEFVNTTQNQFGKITQSVLRPFDLVIASQETIDDLPGSDIITLEESIRSGLGLVILFQQSTLKNATRKFFSLTTSAREIDTVSIGHPAWKKMISIHTAPIKLTSREGANVIWSDTKDEPVAGFERRGIGKVSFQFMDQTHHLMLEGKKETYSQLWSLVLEATARTARPAVDVRIQSRPPFFVGEPLAIEVIASPGALQVALDGEALPLREDELVDDRWTTTAWPLQPGWHQLIANDSVTLPFFVFDDGEWKSLRAVRERAENQQHHTHVARSPSVERHWERVNAIYFFLMLLISVGFLWLSPKL